jgi:predicted transcriptional regulator
MDKNAETLLQEIVAKTGWSQTRIANEIGSKQPTVSRIINSTVDCKGSTLRAIFALHQRVCMGKRKRAKPPISPPPAAE